MTRSDASKPWWQPLERPPTSAQVPAPLGLNDGRDRQLDSLRRGKLVAKDLVDRPMEVLRIWREGNWPDGWFESLITQDEQKGARRSAVKDQRILNGIEAQTVVINAGPEFWNKARAWGDARQVLSATESSILAVASVPGKLPSEKQSIRAIEAPAEVARRRLAGWARPAELIQVIPGVAG